jgi:outer membrane protein assembly factor BamB
MVPAGQTTVTFQIPTTFVANQQSATITATYGDSNSVFVNLLPLTLANTAWPENRANSFGTGQGVSTVSGSNLVWQFQAGGTIESSFAIGPDGSIYFGCDDGCLYALAADGQLEWKFKAGISNSSIANPAVAADGTIYTLGGNGTLFAIRADGTLKWSYETGQSLSCPVSVAANGTIYFAAIPGGNVIESSKIFAVYPDGNLYWATWVYSGGSGYAVPVVHEICVRPDGSLCFSAGHSFVMSPQGVVTYEFYPGSKAGSWSDAVIDRSGNEYFCFKGTVFGFDPSGHEVFRSTLNYPEGDLGIAMSAESNILVSEIVPYEVLPGDYMPLIVTSISTSGATNWTSTVGTDCERVSSLTTDAASSVFFEYQVWPSSYYLCKLDRHGNVQWQIPISSLSTPIVTGDNALIAATGVGVVSKLK